VGISLFGPYLLGVELASFLLLAGLVAAHRLTRDDVDDQAPAGQLREGEPASTDAAAPAGRRGGPF
jgi:NADH-quinone oxidoreductase subunit J